MTWNEIKEEVNTVGVWFDAGGFGDRLQFSSFPENFFKNTGRKLLIPFQIDCYLNNPFVEVAQQDPDLLIDLWMGYLYFTKTKKSYKIIFPRLFRSLAEKYLIFTDFKLFLNRPRLYAYEFAQTRNLAVMHRTGKTVGELPDDVTDFIAKRFQLRGLEIVQIGGKDDRPIGGAQDQRGRNLFETASILAQSSVFIGVNSGMYHLASCYPIQKKIILNQYENEAQLENFVPCAYGVPLQVLSEDTYPKNCNWLDFNAEYYNLSDRDIGFTRSFLTI